MNNKRKNIITVAQNSPTDPIADAWTTYSSRRWKTNIMPITESIDMSNHTGLTLF